MNILRRYLPFFVLTTCLCGIVFLVAQQGFRINANDPQVQLSEDIASQLSTQTDTFQITQLPRVQISSSLSPFVIIYNADGKVISSSGEMDGVIPTPPDGVFAYAKEHNDDRITWKPKPDVRIAAVIRHFTGRTTGYVLAGRSLREVEKREDMLQTQVALGWIVTNAALLFAVLLTGNPEKKKK